MKNQLKIKSIVTILTVLAVASTVVLTGCTKITGTAGENPQPQTKPLVVMITDTWGLGDQGANDEAWAGCEKAGDKEKVDIRCVESSSPEDFENNIEMAVHDQATVIVCNGAQLTESTREAAIKYPDTQFIIIDGIVDLPNVTSISYEDQEGAFLSGVAAATVTTSGKVGIITSLEDSKESQIYYGFLAGVKAVNPAIEVLFSHVDKGDKDGAKGAAIGLADGGADVVLQVTGKGVLGVVEASREKGFWVIGSIKNQTTLDSKHVLCSMTRSGETAVYNEIKSSLKNKHGQGVVKYNLKNEGLSLSYKEDILPKESVKVVDKWKTSISEGKIIVPYDKATWDSFVIPPEER